MINWNLNEIVFAIYDLSKFRRTVEGELEKDENGFVTSYFSESHKYIEDVIFEPLQKLGMSADRINSVRFYLTYGGLFRDLAHELKALEFDITSHGKREWFYHYPHNKGDLLFSMGKDWDNTLLSFPGIKKDIFSAIDCYALGHDRASIYHSMIVLEHGLVALAKRVGVAVNPNKSTWGSLITDIQKKINTRRMALAHPPGGSAPLSSRAAKSAGKFLDTCEESATEFRYFASVWRNHIAHARGDYDENDAKKVLDHVRSFMEIIVTKLRLKERR